jgi:ribose transport system substrate-binding protein
MRIRLIMGLLTGASMALALAAPAFAQDALGLRPDVQVMPNAHDVAEKPAKTGPFKIGFSNISIVNTWRVQMVAETKYEASQHKEISRFFVTDAGGSVNKQVSDIQDLIARGIDALIIAPGSETALNPAITRAYKKGIPVIIFSSDVKTPNYTSKILSDDAYFGRVGAEYLVKALNGKGKLIALRGIAGVSIDDDRWNAAQEVFKKYPDIQIIGSDYGDWAYDKGKRICETMVAAHPQIDGIWSSGGAMTQGCAEVLKENNRPLVPMTGEGNNGFLRTWDTMKLHSVGPISPTWSGAEAVIAALRVLEGKPLKSDYTSRPTPITDATIAAAFKPNLNDSYWVGSILPDATLTKMYGK